MHNLSGRCMLDESEWTPPGKNGVLWRQLKYRRRCFVTWTQEAIGAELADLLAWVWHRISNRFS